MKIKKGFLLHTISGLNVVVPTRRASTVLNGVIKLNESGKFLWNLLEKGAEKDQLIDSLAAEYELTREKATRDVEAFLESLWKIGCLEG